MIKQRKAWKMKKKWILNKDTKKTTIHTSERKFLSWETEPSSGKKLSENAEKRTNQNVAMKL